MAYTDRIKEAAYTSAEGNRFVFQWEKTEESFDHRASVFRFPNKDGALIPDKGVGERRYPLTTFITGLDYDIEAATVMDILAEKGNGVLEHPIYGRKTVQVTNVKREDQPLDSGGQAIISVLFLESTEAQLPESSEDIKKNIDTSQQDFETDTPQDFADQKGVDSAQDLANSESRFGININSINEFLAPIAKFNEQVNARFNAVSKSLNNNLTTLVGKPLVLASQTLALIRTPARIAKDLELRISGYSNLAGQIRDRAVTTFISNDSRNNVLESRFILSGIVAAMAETILFETFTTKSSALTSANALLDFHDLNRGFIEGEEGKFQDTGLDLLLYGDSQEAKTLNGIVQLTAARLADLSFDLKQERTITTARPRTIIDLTHELYGNIEIANIDLLISVNGLKDEQIILIPRGKDIIYYV